MLADSHNLCAEETTMPVAADFTIINDGKITLNWHSQNSVKTFKFSLPGLVQGSPAVLTFVCLASGKKYLKTRRFALLRSKTL